MNGKGLVPLPPGAVHPAFAASPHHPYMPMPPGAATFGPSVSPSSSVLMTPMTPPKSAGVPPCSQLMTAKQHTQFVLHHPTNHTPTQTTYIGGQSQSAPWGAAHNQFVFPSPTGMTFSNPSPLPTSSPVCTAINTIPTPNPWWCGTEVVGLVGVRNLFISFAPPQVHWPASPTNFQSKTTLTDRLQVTEI